MRQTTRKLLCIAAGLAALSLLMCADPTSQNAVRWNTAIQVPLVNGTFVLGEQIQKWVDQPPAYNSTTRTFASDSGLIRVVNADSTYYPGNDNMQPDTVKGNTIGFAIADKDTTTFQYVQDKMEDKRFDVVLGPIPLNSAPSIDTTAPIPGPGALGPVTFTKSLAPRITYVRFASTSPAANLTVTNNTTGTLTNVSVNLQGVGTGTIASIAAGGAGTAQIPVAGHSIGNSVDVTVSLTAAAAGAADLSFSFAGLLADSVRVLDSLVACTFRFTNAYDITDSADISYLDYLRGSLNYTMQNLTGVTLFVHAEHRDLWDADYCDNRSIHSLADLTAYMGSHSYASDSLDTLDDYYGYRVISGASPIRAGLDTVFGGMNLARLRMFPQWNNSLSECVTYVDYTVSLVPANAQVTLTSHDAIIFWIRSNNIQGGKMWGHLKYDYQRESDTQDVAVNYPFDSAQISQLRGKFIFDSVMVDVAARMLLPGQAYLDSLDLLFQLYDPNNPASQVTSHTTFGKVKNDTVLTVTLNVTALVNNWPSTLKARAHAVIPQGTEVYVINDDLSGGAGDTTNAGKMTIHGALHYRVTPYFKYHVNSMATIMLGNASSFDMGSGMEAARKLANAVGELNMHVKNLTNVNVKLRGLLAPDSNGVKGHSLDTMLQHIAIDSLYTIATTLNPYRMPGGYLNILDTAGLYIPPRGDTFNNDIIFSDSELATFLRCKRAASVWLLTFMQNTTTDALRDTDVVDIISSVKVTGITSTDSLFSSWK